MLKSAQSCKKFTFLESLRTITQEGNMKTIQITSFFHLLFPLELFVTFIFVFENCQNSFSCGPAFGPFWSVRYLNFERKLPIWTTHHTFLESRKTKNSYYVFPLRGAKKKVSAHGLIPSHFIFTRALLQIMHLIL